MKIENSPELVDTRRAMALLRFCVPGQLDIVGINSVFDEISQDGRIGSVHVGFGHHLPRPPASPPHPRSPASVAAHC